MTGLVGRIVSWLVDWPDGWIGDDLMKDQLDVLFVWSFFKMYFIF